MHNKSIRFAFAPDQWAETERLLRSGMKKCALSVYFDDEEFELFSPWAPSPREATIPLRSREKPTFGIYESGGASCYIDLDIETLSLPEISLRSGSGNEILICMGGRPLCARADTKTNWVKLDTTVPVLFGNGLRAPKSAAALSHLRQLSVVKSDPAWINIIAKLTNMEDLRFRDENLQDISPLAGLTRLKDLSLRECWSLCDINALAGLSDLVNLNLSGTQLKSLEPLSSLKHLESLDIELIRASRRGIQPLAALCGLRKFYYDHDRSRRDLETLSGFTNLERLQMHFSRSLQDAEPFARMKRLRYLDLSWCRALRNLDALAGLKELRELDLYGCRYVESIAPLASLKHLRRMDVSGARFLDDLSPLETTSLVDLWIGPCKAIQDGLGPLGRLRGLTCLGIEGSRDIKDVSPLAKLAQLRRLKISGCKSLRDLEPLRKLRFLEEVELRNCGELQSFTPHKG
ncbi:MAG: leucine-rich repeat domain-containing protein [Candidatus Sumerlaeota bacterium]|nr:leucine-rich repeat domain-containing protein [Candidatus Sumerlaeota bacterium]